MQIIHATAGVPGRANEDYVCAGPDWALVLDGATRPSGADTGCVHDVVWLVRHLAAAITVRLVLADGQSLADVLAAAIKETCSAHGSTCDLANPDSPSSTVAMVRARDRALEYLVLGDSPAVISHADGTFRVIEDDRLSHLPGGRPYTHDLVRAHRNRDGGFWVASTEPDAAYQAVAGVTEVQPGSEAGLFTDGITRLADWYGHTWPAIFPIVRAEGPAALISLVRAAERADPLPRGKRHDDATVVHLRDLC